MTPQEKLIAVAKAEVGYLEKASNAKLDSDTANAGTKNWTKYARDLDNLGNFYNGKKNGYDWCDVFTDWCFVQAFGKETALKLLCAPIKSCGAGCKYSAGYYKNKGQFHTSNPQAGDQIFFGTGSTWQHTGIVVKVDSKYVYTIEGNTSGASGVVSNGGGVAEKKYLLTYNRILGYGRPDWSIVGGKVEETKVEKPITTTNKTVKVAPAHSFSKNFAKTYKVNAKDGLNMRSKAGTKMNGVKVPIITTLKHGDKFTCYGYYTNNAGTIWLLGVDGKGNTGFCSKKYLS